MEILFTLIAVLLLLALIFAIIVFPVITIMKLNKLSNSLQALHQRLYEKDHPKEQVCTPVPPEITQIKSNIVPTAPVVKEASEEVPEESSEACENIAYKVPSVTPKVIPRIQAQTLTPVCESKEKKAFSPAPPSATTPPLKEQTPGEDRFGQMLDQHAENINNKLDVLQERTVLIAKKIWSWLCVGEEYRNKNVANEYIVGTTWLIRLGILILLCGFGFFLKYSIDRNWTTPTVRVIMMAFAGLAMVAGGFWKQHSKYRPLATASAGGGFVTLYLSIMAAYKLYALLPVNAAFALMIVVSIAAMLTSLKLNALTTALIGCAGGFLTPAFINSGSKNVVGLMIYLAILSAGTLLVARRREWTLLNIASFIFYVIIAVMPVEYYTNATNALFVMALLAVNYLIYSWQLTTAAEKRDLSFFEILLMIANAIFYLGLTIELANRFYGDTKLAAAAVLLLALAGALEIAFARYKYQSQRPALTTLLYIKFIFGLILTVPLLFSNLWVIAAWSVLAMLIVEAALRLRSKLLLFFAALLYMAAAIREAAVPSGFAGNFDSYFQTLLAHLLTAGVYITSLTFSGVRLIRQSSAVCNEENDSKANWCNDAGKLFIISGTILFFIYSSYEIFSAVKNVASYNYRHASLVIYWSVLAGIIAYIASKINYRKVALLQLALLALTGIWMLTLETPQAYAENFLKGLIFTVVTTGIYIVSLVITAGEFLKKSRCSDIGEEFKTSLQKTSFGLYTLAGILFFVYSSREVYEMFDTYLVDFRNGGLSIYWSILAFVMLIFGLSRKIRSFRLCGFTLFAVTAGKIFFIDLAGLEQLWRIVAFVVIGVVMLIGAVIYIKYEDIFVNKESQDQ